MNTFLGFYVGVPKTVLYGSLFLLVVVSIVIIKNRFRLTDYIRNIVFLVLAELLFLILCATVVYRQSFGYYKINVIPYFDYIERIKANKYYDVWEIYLNIALFIPIGLLLYYLYNISRWKECLLTCVCISLCIEFLQLLLQKGLCEVNDVIHNTLGCVIGMIFFLLIYKVKQRIKKQ